MNKTILLIFTFFLILLMVGCKSELDKESRSPGEIAFRSNCQNCHILPKPSMKSDEQWPEIVEKYGTKAKLTVADQKEIISYLIAHN